MRRSLAQTQFELTWSKFLLVINEAMAECPAAENATEAEVEEAMGGAVELANHFLQY